MGDDEKQIDRFTFMRSYLDAVEDLDEKDQAAALLAIVRYGLDGKEPAKKGTVRAILRGLKPVLDKSRTMIVARAAAGKKGKGTSRNVGNTNARKHKTD